MPSRHVVLASPFRALRTRLPSLRSVVPSRHITQATLALKMFKFVKIRATEQVAIKTQEKEIRVNSCDSWAYKNLSWSTKNSPPIRNFFPRKTFQPFSILLIYLYIRKIRLKGLSRKPFRTIHNQIALEGLALCLPAPQFKADNFC